MTPAEKIKVNWIPMVIQTIFLLIAIIGFAVSNEHRITALESSESMVSNNVHECGDMIKELQRNQIRISTLLESIEERHRSEDRRAARERNNQ